MSELVVALHEIRPEDAPRVGNKASSLARLLQAGFPVPGGVCVTTSAFSSAIASYGNAIQAVLSMHNLAQRSETERASKRLMDLLENWAVPARVMAILEERWPDLLMQRLAVRSSAGAEDQPEASYAGQYSTVLGIQAPPTLENAILTCWKSFYAPHALMMRAAHNAVATNQGMAIIIQPLIEADCAGVCYSVDPIRKRRDLLINAVWGLGPGVVDGSIASDTYRIHGRSFDVIERHVVLKPERIVVRDAGLLEFAPVSDELHNAACLPDAWVTQIAQFGVAAETLFGRPQDIEWAIADGQIWILQCRPLTALPSELLQVSPFPVNSPDADPVRALWHLREAGGIDRGPILPLEQAHIQIQEEMRDETCRFMGEERNQEVRFFNGRAYTRPLPVSITPGDLRIRRQAMGDLQERLHEQGLTSWDYWGPEIVAANERLRAINSIGADGEALAVHLENAIAVRRRHYMLHPMCWFKPLPSYFTALEKVTGLTGDAARRLGYQLLEGEETPLTKLVDQLYALAQLARDKPALQALIRQPPEDVVERLNVLPEADTFVRWFEELLLRYGDRTGDGYGSETTIATPTWRERPHQPLQLVSAYLTDEIDPPSAMRARIRYERERGFEDLCRACDDQGAVEHLRRERDYARRCFAVLEIHNHHIDQTATGQLRRAVMSAAHWLAAKRLLIWADNVVWLNFREILASLRGPGSVKCVDMVVHRQLQFQEWRKLEAPPVLGIPDSTLPFRTFEPAEMAVLEPANDGVLRGTGASPGNFQGRAYLMPDHEIPLPNLISGTVLVAKNVGPRWTPLFPLLGALVLDGGSIGQHAAAIAREYGIPAVVETKDATRRIPHEATVSVNGTTGEVHFSPSEELPT